MASSSSSTLNSNNAFLILELKDPLSTETDFYKQKEKKNEIFISNEDISHINITSVYLTSHIIKVEANRKKLIDESSYFRSLLIGNLSESCIDSVSVKWNLEIVMDILNFIYGFGLNISINNFFPPYGGWISLWSSHQWS
ncbi:BTB/POZ domain-containing FBL11-like protein [Thalictrum thalictroides]|uniref:BTB/POZ domain-containing FBL11-like protein n=1 Tax=Thalictrum thalictroides TaxID=46969 RepID=A0A7J6W5V1_THATH|nr:BTB/POZ domain-containing FBL11-like protein [Thalictrum thalictroides]